MPETKTTKKDKETKKENINRHPDIIRLKNRHIQELNRFLAENRFYAFESGEKFDEGMKKLGLEPTDTDKIVDVGGGAMRRDKVPELRALIERQGKELREMKKALRGS